MSIAGKISILAISAALSGMAFSASAEPKTELILAIGGEADNGYDPLFGWGQYGHPLFQSTLWKRDADLATQPDLAKSWSLSDDKLTWTIEIRDDVKFSDGKPLTAEDVAFTFNQAASAGGVIDLTVLDKAEATDATTVTIKLKKPWITFVENFYALGIVPAASYTENYGRNPVGSGPYMLVSWTEGEQLVVQQNPHYYGEKNPFEKLTFVFAGEDTAFAAASSGQVDMISVPGSLAERIPAGFRRVVVNSVDNRGISFPMSPDEGKTTPTGNKIGNNVTSDLAIRRAVNAGIDRSALIDVALHGYGKPAYGPADGLPWGNTDNATPYDLDAAKAMLDEAGWVAGSDGVRVKDGVRAAFPLNYPSSDSTRQALALTAAELLRDIGIEAKANGITWDTIHRIKNSEPVVFGWGSHSPVELYNLYHSSQAGNGSYNVGYLQNKTIDGYLETAQNAENLEASTSFWQKADWDGTTGFGAKGEAAWAWLVNLDHIYLVNDCLDIGKTQTEPHGHGWPITAGIQNWKWTCE